MCPISHAEQAVFVRNRQDTPNPGHVATSDFPVLYVKYGIGVFCLVEATKWRCSMKQAILAPNVLAISKLNRDRSRFISQVAIYRVISIPELLHYSISRHEV